MGDGAGGSSVRGSTRIHAPITHGSRLCSRFAAMQPKRLLNKNGVPFKSIELDLRRDGQQLQDAVRVTRRFNHTTVPAIFHNGEFLGGSEVLTKNVRVLARK